MSVDSSIVRAHQHAAGEPGDHAIGRSRGGLTTKIHLARDGHGRPLSVALTGGNVNDCTQFTTVMAGVDPAGPHPDAPYSLIIDGELFDAPPWSRTHRRVSRIGWEPVCGFTTDQARMFTVDADLTQPIPSTPPARGRGPGLPNRNPGITAAASMSPPGQHPTATGRRGGNLRPHRTRLRPAAGRP
nr:transposase [Amycolatopsis australiensis]